MGGAYLHGRISGTHEQHQQRHAALRHGRHGHGHAQGNDCIGTADDGPKKENQRKHQGHRNGQAAKKGGQFMNHPGGCDDVLEHHDQHGIKNNDRFKGSPEHGLDFPRLQPVHKHVQYSHQRRGYVDRYVKCNDQRHNQYDGPQAAQQHFSSRLPAAFRNHPGRFWHLAQEEKITDKKQRCHQWEHGHHKLPRAYARHRQGNE